MSIKIFILLLLYSLTCSLWGVTTSIHTYSIPSVTVKTKKEGTEIPASSSAVVAIKNEAESLRLSDRIRITPGVTFLQEGGAGQQASLMVRGGEASHTLVVLDGVPLNDNTNPTGTFNLTNLKGLPIEKVEVLRGPQVALFGSGAMAGVLKLTSQKNRSPKWFRFWGEGGSYGSSWTSISGGGGDSKMRGVYSVQLGRSSGKKESSIKPYRQGNYSLNVTSSVHPQHELSLFFTHSEGKNGIDKWSGPGGEDPNGEAQVKQTFAKGEVESFINEKLTTTTLFGVRRVSRLYHTEIFDGQYKGDTQIGELKGNLKINNNNQIWTGGEYNGELVRTTEKSEWASTKLERKKASTSSLYSLHQWKMGGFSSHQGVRWQYHSLSHSAYNVQWTPSYYFESLDMSLESGYGRSTKFPSLYQLYSPEYGNDSLHPEKSDTYELALIKPIGEKLHQEVRFFYNDYHELIEYSGKQYQNGGKAKSYGYELIFKQSLHPSFDIQENFTYLVARKDPSKAYLLRRARYQANGVIIWKPIDPIEWGMRGEFLGRRDDYGGTSPSYTLFHSQINYKVQSKNLGDFQLGFEVQNIFNRHYEAIKDYQSPGRSAYLSVAWDYDKGH